MEGTHGITRAGRRRNRRHRPRLPRPRSSRVSETAEPESQRGRGVREQGERERAAGTHGRARAARRRSRHRHPRLTRTLGTSHERRHTKPRAPFGSKSAPTPAGQRRRLRLGCSGSARAAPAPACGRVERPRRGSPRSVSSRRAATRRTPLRSAGCPARPSGPTRVGSPAGGAAPPLRLRCSGLLRSGLPVQLSRCSANYRLDFSAPFASSPAACQGCTTRLPPSCPFWASCPSLSPCLPTA